MARRRPSNGVSFDADECLDAALETIDGPLYTFVEFNQESYTPLYVDELALTLYEDEEEMHAHFDRLHSYVSLDFTEIDLFLESLIPLADRVDYIATTMDYIKLVRFYRDREGLFFAVDPDEPIVPIIDAIEASVGA